MRINFVIPNLRSQFTGGVECVIQYANGLSQLGYEVTIVPLQFSGMPDSNLLPVKAKVIRIIDAEAAGRELSLLLRLLMLKFKEQLFRISSPALSSIRKALVEAIAAHLRGERRYTYFTETCRRILAAGSIPDCDINIATSYATALPVYLSGKGRAFYFLQHFEELFAIDNLDAEFALWDAHITYSLPLQKIANSKWLQDVIRRKFGEVIPVVNNAIDHGVFKPMAGEQKKGKRVVSYGGRYARWKGFPEAVKAMKLVRQRLPEVEWIVYGPALVQPDNVEAPYTSAGAVYGAELARLYSSADVVLCPAWYESFPLYPLEAMACGGAVVTTPFGTEDYALDGVNALVVPARNEAAMAEAVIRLLTDQSLRQRMVSAGLETAKQFTWEKSVKQMEKTLLDGVAAVSNPKRFDEDMVKELSMP